MKFKVAIASQPMQTKGRKGEDVYPAHVSLAGVLLFSTAISSPGGPDAAREMRHEVMVQFAHRLHEILVADDVLLPAHDV
jgi:hypothetical protein